MKKYLLVCATIALAAAACSSTDDSSDTTVPATLTTTSSTSTSTTTEAPEVTTTTTTTEVPEATTTTTTEAPEETTTTTAAPVPSIIELTNEGIQAGAVWVPFGADDDDAVAAIEAVLGAPTTDSGWIPAWGDYGVCPDPMVRAVEWDALITLYTSAESDFWSPAGTEHFFSFNYLAVESPPNLLTPEGIGIGSTLAELKAAYPGEIVVDEAFFDPALGFWSYRPMNWTGLWGYASGQADTSTITSINGGSGCGE
jgi:hypothetical protein